MTTGGSGWVFHARELARPWVGTSRQVVPGEGSTFCLTLPKFTEDAPSIDRTACARLL